MSQERQDNCLLGSPSAIRSPEDLPLRDESSQTIGGSLSRSINATNVQPSRVRASRHTMQFFVPRPFPPPALAHVPIEYILDQLHNLAPHYWSKPETADCTLIVPLDGLLRRTGQASRLSAPYVSRYPGFTSKEDELEQIVPPTYPAPRMVMKVHSDYLSAHSTLLRSLFSGGCSSTPDSPLFQHHKSPSPSPLPSTTRGLPIAPHYPRLLPSTPSHPTVYLPLPDPASFRLLVHYMYFGSTAYIEDALDTGAVTWEGLARNVEFLGMDMEIKMYLGRWYNCWQRGRRGDSRRVEEFDDSSDSDDDSVFETDDEDTEEESVTSASDDEDEMTVDECLKRVPEPPRGRQRTPRRLGHAVSDPGPIRERNSRRTLHVSQSSTRGMSE